MSSGIAGDSSKDYQKLVDFMKRVSMKDRSTGDGYEIESLN